MTHVIPVLHVLAANMHFCHILKSSLIDTNTCKLQPNVTSAIMLSFRAESGRIENVSRAARVGLLDPPDPTQSEKNS